MRWAGALYVLKQPLPSSAYNHFAKHLLPAWHVIHTARSAVGVQQTNAAAHMKPRCALTASSLAQPTRNPAEADAPKPNGHLDAQALQHVLDAAGNEAHAVHHGSLAQRLQVPC